MALADADVGIGTLKIPLSIRRLQPFGRQYSIGVWSYFQLIDFTDSSTVFRSWLLNDAGEALLYFDHVHLQEVRDEHIQKVLQNSGRAGAEQQTLYGVDWREMEEPEELLAAPTAEWLVLGGKKALDQLSLSKEKRCRCVAGADLTDEAGIEKLLKEKLWAGVVLADGLVEDLGDVDVVTEAMHLARVVSKNTATAPALWFLTQGAQPCVSDDEDARKKGSATHSGLWGFARALRMEYPGAQGLRGYGLSSLRITYLLPRMFVALLLVV